jgi:Spy/CpxP family protein refolding chaperone
MKVNTIVTAMITAAALLTLSIPAPAFSEVMEMGHMDKMSDMMGKCLDHADEMGLTDAQVMKIKPVHTDMQKKQARYKADQKIAEIELAAILDVKDFDLDTAMAAVNKIAKIQTDHHLEMLTAMKEMRSLMTDEQFKKMKKMMAMKTDKKTAKKMKNHN